YVNNAPVDRVDPSGLQYPRLSNSTYPLPPNFPAPSGGPVEPSIENGGKGLKERWEREVKRQIDWKPYVDNTPKLGPDLEPSATISKQNVLDTIYNMMRSANLTGLKLGHTKELLKGAIALLPLPGGGLLVADFALSIGALLAKKFTPTHSLE